MPNPIDTLYEKGSSHSQQAKLSLDICSFFKKFILSSNTESITPKRAKKGMMSISVSWIDSGKTRKKTTERITPEPIGKKKGFLINENLRNRKAEIKGRKNKMEIPPNIFKYSIKREFSYANKK